MPDIDNTLADNEPGHTLHHVDLATEVNSLRARMLANESKDTAQDTTLASKYTKPGEGAGLDLLSPAALAGLVQTDGTVLRAVKLTQAAYDALPTKVATTLYVITA